MMAIRRGKNADRAVLSCQKKDIGDAFGLSKTIYTLLPNTSSQFKQITNRSPIETTLEKDQEQCYGCRSLLPA